MAGKIKHYLANEIYSNIDYQETIDFLKKQAGKRKKLLDTNCRDGKLLNELKKQGFEVSGLVESRKDFENVSNKVACPLFKTSITKFRTKEKYEIITSLFSAFNKLKNYEKLDLALHKMTKCLNSDGIIVLQVLKITNSGKQQTGGNLLDTSVAKRKKSKLKVVNTFKKGSFSFRQKAKYQLFDIEKIAYIAMKNGLKLVDVSRNSSSNIPGEFGDNVQIVLAFNTEETKQEKSKRKRQFVTKKGKVKTLSRKVHYTSIVAIVLVGFFLGTMVGDFYNSNFTNQASFDYTNEQIQSAYALDDPSIDALSDEVKLGDNSIYVFMKAEKLSFNRTFHTQESGSLAVMGITQRVANITTVSPAKRTKIAASIGMVSLATKTVWTKNGDDETVQQFSGTPTDLSAEEFATNWSGPDEKITTPEEYQSIWGVTPAWITPYIICSSTVAEKTNLSKEGDDFTATLTLKTEYNTTASDKTPLMAYSQYVHQINAMSGVVVTDVEYCKITFTIDKDYKIKKIVIDEQYNVRYGVIPVTCPSKLTQEFFYD